MNETWHRTNPMPPGATFEQRVAWHRKHAIACACRQPPPAVAAVLAGEQSTASPPKSE